MKTIKLMADYGCHPLWHVASDECGDIAPDELPLSAKLRSRLSEWARLYDKTLNMEAPPESGFKSQEQEEAFKVEGRRLVEQLRIELGGDFVVISQL